MERATLLLGQREDVGAVPVAMFRPVSQPSEVAVSIASVPRIVDVKEAVVSRERAEQELTTASAIKPVRPQFEHDDRARAESW
jgi:hypothetical protein